MKTFKTPARARSGRMPLCSPAPQCSPHLMLRRAEPRSLLQATSAWARAAAPPARAPALAPHPRAPAGRPRTAAAAAPAPAPAGAPRPTSSRDAPALEPSDGVLKLWRSANAVCFDVDCTITTNDSLDLLAEFMGVGARVAEVTNKVRPGRPKRRAAQARRSARAHDCSCAHAALAGRAAGCRFG